MLSTIALLSDPRRRLICIIAFSALALLTLPLISLLVISKTHPSMMPSILKKPFGLSVAKAQGGSVLMVLRSLKSNLMLRVRERPWLFVMVIAVVVFIVGVVAVVLHVQASADEQNVVKVEPEEQVTSSEEEPLPVWAISIIGILIGGVVVVAIVTACVWCKKRLPKKAAITTLEPPVKLTLSSPDEVVSTAPVIPMAPPVPVVPKEKLDYINKLYATIITPHVYKIDGDSVLKSSAELTKDGQTLVIPFNNSLPSSYMFVSACMLTGQVDTDSIIVPADFDIMSSPLNSLFDTVSDDYKFMDLERNPSVEEVSAWIALYEALVKVHFALIINCLVTSYKSGTSGLWRTSFKPELFNAIESFQELSAVPGYYKIYDDRYGKLEKVDVMENTSITTYLDFLNAIYSKPLTMRTRMVQQLKSWFDDDIKLIYNLPSCQNPNDPAELEKVSFCHLSSLLSEKLITIEAVTIERLEFMARRWLPMCYIEGNKMIGLITEQDTNIKTTRYEMIFAGEWEGAGLVDISPTIDFSGKPVEKPVEAVEKPVEAVEKPVEAVEKKSGEIKVKRLSQVIRGKSGTKKRKQKAVPSVEDQ